MLFEESDLVAYGRGAGSAGDASRPLFPEAEIRWGVRDVGSGPKADIAGNLDRGPHSIRARERRTVVGPVEARGSNAA
jgi:hypothetical protein